MLRVQIPGSISYGPILSCTTIRACGMTSTTAARVCRSAPCALQLGHTYIPPPGSGLSRVCVIPDLLSGTISRYSLAQSSAHIPVCMHIHVKMCGPSNEGHVLTGEQRRSSGIKEA